MSKEEAQFLHQRDAQLHTSGPVELAAQQARYRIHQANSQLAPGEERLPGVPNEPTDKIDVYLGSLANHSLVAKLPDDDPTKTSQLLQRRKRQIEARLIKETDIPESFFEGQRRAGRELGQGDIEVGDEMRAKALEVFQTDQRESLLDWVNYLTDKDTIYPTWFTYYTLNAVTKLADYDKNKGQFTRRSRRTTGPFPGLNREALSYVYDNLVNHYGLVQDEAGEALPIEDEELIKLLQTGNFGKLYAKALEEVGFTDPELLKITRGSWAKYDQTHDPREVKRLADALKPYGTGWCTSGEGWARSQLAAGDFYVFYTEDTTGVARVPRVAIRMQGDEVVEVRGIVGGGEDIGPAENQDQELEAVMVDTAMSRLMTLPGGEAYQKKAADMKQLTAIEHKVKAEPHVQLTQAELRFLYEIDQSIEGFGYNYQNGRGDPRVAEIRQLRGEADYPLLGRLVREQLKEQLAPSYNAYSQVVSQMNDIRRRDHINVLDRSDIERAMEAKVAEWEKSGAFDYLVERLIRHGQRFSLVMTPNVLADANEVMGLAKNFGKDQPHETFLYRGLYEQYDAQQLSGSLEPGTAVRFSLVPGKADPELGVAPVEEQLGNLRAFQAKRSLLDLHVPSVLQAITYWQTLRANGDKLADETAGQKTYIRHFDLPGKRFGDWLDVPSSFVRVDGKPCLVSSDAEFGSGARVAVG